MLGLSQPAFDRPRVAWRLLEPGHYRLWCAADIVDTPWWAGPAKHRGAPVVHTRGDEQPMRRCEPGDVAPGRIRAKWTADVVATAPHELVPIWFGDANTPADDSRPYILAPALEGYAGATDVHAHLGRLNGEDYAPELMEDLLSEAHVKRAWVSNLDGATYTQLEANRRVLDLTAGRPSLEPVFWANPVEGLSKDVELLLSDPRFVGLKLHPELNQFPADDRRLDRYLDLAAERGMFALFHTDRAENSRPERLAALAARHPKVNFIAGHMGLWGAQEEALKAIREAPAQNIWGDLAWFHRFDLLAKEIAAGRTTRFVFGSDAPVDGEESYQQYLMILYGMSVDEPILRALFVDNPRALRP